MSGARALPILDGWAVVAPSGHGLDDSMQAASHTLRGRELRGYVEGRGEIVTSPIAHVWRMFGAWHVRTRTDSEYTLGDPIWSRLKKTGSER